MFVNYESGDVDFACHMADELTRAGYKVWFAGDKDRLRAGDKLRETLTQAIKTSRHIVLIINEDWSRKAWPLWEAGVFLEDPRLERRLIPVLRARLPTSGLPPFLNEQSYLRVYWLPNEANPSEPFSKILDGLGHPDMKVDKTSPAGPAAPSFVVTVRLGRSDLALTCDRDDQWGKIDKYAMSQGNEAFFVVGPVGQGHEFFLERARKFFRESPTRVIKSVDWSPFPTPSDRILSARLADSFGCRPDRLVDTLRQLLQGQNVVLLHEPVAGDLIDEETLFHYYTRFLPDLLEKIDPQPEPYDRIGNVKVIQAIQWPAASAIAAGLETLLTRVGWSRPSLARGGANDLLRRLSREAHSRLPIVVLNELQDIRREDLDDFFRTVLREPPPPGFVERVFSTRRASTEVFHTLIKELDSREARTDD